MGKKIPIDEYPICKYCNSKKVKFLHWKKCDSPECASAAKKASLTVWLGKTRPDHAKIISSKLKGVPKTAAHKKNMKTNSEHYKKKMLDNKNIQYTNESYQELWKKLISDTRKGNAYKKTCVSNWFSFNIDDVEKFDAETLDLYYKKFNSEKSIKAMYNHPKMGNGLRETISDLKFCINRTEITTRSFWESSFVKDFLEKNKIYYKYEAFYIENYLPDFIVEFDGKKYIIEIKGTIYSDKIKKLEQDFINARNSGFNFIIINTPYFKSWDIKTLFTYEIKSIDELKNFINKCNIYERGKNND